VTRPGSGPRRLLPILIPGVIVFLFISALLARALSVDSAERSAITAVVTGEAHGDTAAVLARLTGCAPDPACRARVGADVAALHHPGAVSIIQIQVSAGFSLTATQGTARVAWAVGGSLPRVQCVRVRRAGNVLSGLRVELLALSARIAGTADCPARF
jgi:hypothetical protein